MELILLMLGIILIVVEIIEHPKKHSVLITILCIITGIFLGFMDFTGSTEHIKNKMRGKSD